MCTLFPRIYIYHHHHVAQLARISMTISHQPSLSFIVPGRSSAQHPTSSHSWSMWVLGGRPTLACPCVGFHRRTSLMSSSLLLQLCPACLVRITRMVCDRGQVAMQLFPHGVLFPRFVQDRTQHPCAAPI